MMISCKWMTIYLLTVMNDVVNKDNTTSDNDNDVITQVNKTQCQKSCKLKVQCTRWRHFYTKIYHLTHHGENKIMLLTSKLSWSHVAGYNQVRL